MEQFFSIFSTLFFIKKQCVESLKMNHAMEIVIKTSNFFHSSSLNHHEFGALLEEIESAYIC